MLDSSIWAASKNRLNKKAAAVALTFDGIEYRTIEDVKQAFRTSEKTIRNLVNSGILPEPKTEARGTRTFRHFDDDWMKPAEAYFNSLKTQKNGK